MSNALALDALESVKLVPHSSVLWQRLSKLTSVLRGCELTALVSAIAALPFGLGLGIQDAHWLRCSALAYLTRDPVWFARQAAVADESFSSDALMAFLGLVWYQALVRTSGQKAFWQFFSGIDAPRLQRLVAARIHQASPARSCVPGAQLRVAIYTPEVANPRHGGTTLTLNVMGVLARQGVDLHGFSAKEMSIPAINSYHGGAEAVTPLEVEVDTLKSHTPGNMPFSFSNAAFSLRSRFDQILRSIDAYAPDVVLFVGFMSPLMYQLHALYPVLALSVHTVPPVVPVDVWLSADPQADDACWDGLPVPQIFPFAFRFWPTEPQQAVERVTVGLPVDSTVLMTAGYRLHTEISASWGEQMLSFIEAQPSVHWLLVGVAVGEVIASLPPHPRIHLIAPQPQLATWLAMCDIYANPARMGGGGTVAMAMEHGLAVAAFANSDGGDKVGEFALHSSQEYLAQLSAWVCDPAARQKAGATMKAWFHSRLDISSEAAAQDMVHACQLAIDSFNQRMKITCA